MTQKSHTPIQLVLIALVGSAAITLGAQVSVPMVPVPTTLQTLVVVVLGLGFGPLPALASTALYLICVLVGLPVLSSGQQAGGSAFFQFLAAGYVVAFIPGAVLAGLLGHQRGFWRRFAAGLASHAIILLLGGLVLGFHIGLSTAVERGVMPFLIGGAAKSLAAAGLVGWNWRPRRRSLLP